MKYNKKRNQKRIRVNDWIRISPVRLIDQNNKNVGVVDLDKAKQLSQQAGLDLIEIAPNVRPPVCRIMDFGKYQYQQSRKEKEQRHKQTKIEVKSIRISPRIGLHDLQFKAKQAEKFLNHGDKVRIEIRMRGREKAHQDVAFEKINQFIELIEIDTETEQAPKREPRGLSMIITKAKEKKKKDEN